MGARREVWAKIRASEAERAEWHAKARKQPRRDEGSGDTTKTTPEPPDSLRAGAGLSARQHGPTPPPFPS